jgi:hypothetical protein
MIRKIAATAVVVLPLLVPAVVFAGAYDDLLRVQAAFQSASSWHADEHFSNGRTVTVDYVAPDRWRIQPSPGITELVIGNDVYMVRNGHASKLPFGGAMIRGIIQHVGFSASDDIRQSATDLGTQALNGQSVHVYSYTTRGTPVTLYVGANWLPVQSIVQDKNLTTTITYSQYNAPISIEAP